MYAYSSLKLFAHVDYMSNVCDTKSLLNCYKAGHISCPLSHSSHSKHIMIKEDKGSVHI